MRGDGRLDLSGFVPPIVHPVKVAILRALAESGKPLGPAELARAIDQQPPTISQTAYHALTLAQQGAVEQIGDESGDRGATCYRLPPQELA